MWGGQSALEWYKDGLFTGPGSNPMNTQWKRGTSQKVIWLQKSYHYGGYSYRLCRVSEGKYWEANEECFQRTPLKFAGLHREQITYHNMLLTKLFWGQATSLGVSIGQ